ncbi:uncharacterized protein BYT42DRAFT_617200 [Radiomyces spectabilis]|uniref:uncharacterized protein n=1 Tax=Radiomyces spectabilis TaxID=64574 RepID=UPI00221F8450|nr:uncharacterized protein BYT42DRAFT_617200 [Radiomyces spectabilis]KAI8370668.1 hypothetical protein BYT42DRAFT_617200 [Radiomyces spectabilis]
MSTARSFSPPSSGYEILDIRTPEYGTVKLSTTKMGAQVPGHDSARPPSPPASTDPSVDAFNSDDLVDTLMDSLNKPFGQKSIPTFVLYDTRGLQLFDEITHLPEYYLTEAERNILLRRADQLADRLKDGSILVELGAGSLKKTQIILQAVERRRLRVTYYALDLDQHELERSLASLGEFQYVELKGLLGTYDQGIPWINHNFTYDKNPTHKMVLWLGSSIGNQSRHESADFLRRIQRTCLQPGDFCVIGFDQRNEPAKIEAAYNDAQGVTREFIMNGLDHVNTILGHNLFDRSKFAYDTRYQRTIGRHTAHYRALEDMTMQYKNKNGVNEIRLKKDELIHVEHSYKYSTEEIDQILNSAELNLADMWTDDEDQYRLVVAECRPFLFKRRITGFVDPKAIVEDERLDCCVCNDPHLQTAGEDDEVAAGADQTMASLAKARWPTTVPTLQEWQQLWRSWDHVTRTMLDHKTMLFERPIALRHPFIFYLGHIPGFLDILLTRHKVDGQPLTEPAHFADIFERGIDPDMDDPTQCHPHSEVPTNDTDWPSINDMMRYQQNIRNRLERILLQWETEHCDNEEWMAMPERQRKARITWMCFEHEAMHLETLLYMLVQSPNIQPPQHVAWPSWKLALMHPSRYESRIEKRDRCLDAAPLVPIDAGSVTIGHHDPECDDRLEVNASNVEYGWDNEHPRRTVDVGAPFQIQTRPVTNGEYLAYLQATNAVHKKLPASWEWMQGEDGEQEVGVKTVFGLCPLSYAMHWPVQVCCADAEAYAHYQGMRLPTEHELLRFRQAASRMARSKIPNIGFAQWHPTDVSNDEIHTLGDVWEWTSTVWDRYPGYETSTIYPGYSSDFFDGKHRTILGGSWATHPRIAERWSFRNWYQVAYPYVFCGFRCCQS